MPVSVALHHRTTYRYGSPVAVGPQLIRLRPALLTRATIRDYRLTVSPEPAALRWFHDPAGNAVAQALFRQPTDTLDIAVAFEAELGDVNPFDFILDPDAVTWPFAYPDTLARELLAYRPADPIRPWLARLLAPISLEPQSPVDLLVSLNQLVFERIAYVTRMEPGVLSPDETVRAGSGSCRDVAWLLVCVARSLGFAARFTSGYLIQLADPDRESPGPAADTLDLHAWAEIYLPGAGWIGFDATSGLITAAGHIPLAGGACPEAAAPVSGTVGLSPAANFEIETKVTRLPI